MKKIFLLVCLIGLVLQPILSFAGTYYIWFLPSGGYFNESDVLTIKRNQGPYVASYWINLRERWGDNPLVHQTIDSIGPFEINRGTQYHYLEEYWPRFLDDWLISDFIIEIKITDKPYRGSKDFWNTIGFLDIMSEDTTMEQYMPVFLKNFQK